MTHPRLRVLTLGGTIAMARGAGGDADDGGVTPGLSGQALLDAVPELARIADVSVESVAAVGSSNLGFETALSVMGIIQGSSADAHLVVTGTDTLEEIAFALDLLLGAHARTVVTGAMRAADAPGADGPANLQAAALTAVNGGLRGRGVVAVLNDTIHAARAVEKKHTNRTDAFESPGWGPAGLISEGSVVFHGLLRRPSVLDGVGPDMRCPPVALWEAGFGDDGRLLDAIGTAGYEAVVVAGFGGGHLSEAQAERAVALAARMPVILASRTGAGRTLMRTYGYRGGERDLIARGLIPAGCYSPRKARIMATLALGAGYGRDDLAKLLMS